jgi:hypothetical protein
VAIWGSRAGLYVSNGVHDFIAHSLADELGSLLSQDSNWERCELVHRTAGRRAGQLLSSPG